MFSLRLNYISALATGIVMLVCVIARAVVRVLLRGDIHGLRDHGAVGAPPGGRHEWHDTCADHMLPPVGEMARYRRAVRGQLHASTNPGQLVHRNRMFAYKWHKIPIYTSPTTKITIYIYKQCTCMRFGHTLHKYDRVLVVIKTQYLTYVEYLF